MSKRSRPLRVLSRIFGAKKKEAPKLPAGSKELHRLGLEGFDRLLAKQLMSLDSGVKLLDAHFPVAEGQKYIDLLASNNLGELIFIWKLERLDAQGVLKLIAQYDWTQKNQQLWEHLFPQAKKTFTLKYKVWCFAGEIDSTTRSVLPYLNGINIHIFQYHFVQGAHEPILVVSPWEFKKASHPPLTQSLHETPQTPSPSSLPHPARAVTSKAPKLQVVEPLPTHAQLTQEELQDLMGQATDVPYYEEDEITEPYYLLSDLFEANKR